ncbi:MAG TPA: aldo/keto reductase [Terrimicrobiaceae bacterium]
MIKIPHTGLEVSRLAMGCMGLGGGFEPGTLLTADHERQAREFLDAAQEVGVNFFDHANVYGRGRSEEVFGRVLKERPSLRDSIVIQSKCGIRWADDPPGTPQRFDFSRDHILESVDAILTRLRTDRLDVLQLHRPDPLWEGEEIAEAFGKLRASGKVRFFGVSNQNRFQMEYLQSFLPDPLVANQVEMSLLHNGFAEASISFNQSSPGYPDGWEGTMEYCRMKGVLLQAWSPLARGILIGEFDGQPENIKRTAALLREYTQRHETTPEAILLAWLLKHPAKIQPVLGTSRPDRLRACAKAVSVSLSREEWYSLFAAARGPMP